MGYQELIDSLRKEGYRKMQALHAEAEAESEKLKTETAGKIRQLREEFQQREILILREQESDALSKARERARALRLEAGKSFSDRLFSLAVSLLPELRNTKYPDLFTDLINELPSAEWKKVRVHPEDIHLAHQHFPGAHIVPDASITGGLEVSRDRGRQHILNTFKKRLERAWEEMLPFLMNDIYQGKIEHGIPAKQSR